MKKRRKSGLVYKFEKGTEDPIREVDDLPPGLWLPISVSACLTGYTAQMIRYLMKNGVVDAIRFEKGPILINHRDVLKKWINYEIK